MTSRRYIAQFGWSDTGLSPGVDSFKRVSDNAAILPNPSGFTHIGRGAYAFSYDLQGITSIGGNSADTTIELGDLALLTLDGNAGADVLDLNNRYCQIPMAPEDQLNSALVALSTAVIAGSSTTEVRTLAAQADGFFDDLVLQVENSAGRASRRIVSYDSTNGAFTVSPPLPFTPAAGNRAAVLVMSPETKPTYTQWALDSGTGLWVYWNTYGAPDPAPTVTRPQFTGTLSSYEVLAVLGGRPEVP